MMSQDPEQSKSLEQRCREAEEENARLAAELRHAQERLCNVFENLNDVYYEISLEGVIREVSPSVQAFSEGQFTRDDLIGVSFAEIYANPAEREKVIETLMRDGKVTDYELLFKNRDGEIIPVSISSKLLFDENNQPNLIVGTMRDIRERKASDEALRETVTRLNKAEELSRIGAWEIDLENRTSFISPSLASMSGLDKTEVPYEEFVAMVPPEDLGNVEKAVEKAIDEGGIYQVFHGIIRADNGQRVELNSRGEVVKDANGNPLKIVGVAQDITEQRRAEATLKKAHELLDETGRIARIGGWAFDARTMEISWTDGLRRILEVPDDYEPTIENSLQLYTPESRPIIEDAAERCYKENESFDLELTTYTYTGRILWVHVIGRAVIEDGKCVRVQGVYQDITERKAAEEEHARLKGLLEAAIEQSPSGILVANAPDGKIQIANPAALGIRDAEPKMLTDIEISEHSEKWQTFYLNGEPYPSEKLPLSRAIRNGETTRNEEVIIRDESGIDHIVNVNAAPVFDDEGNMTAGIVIFHDITEQKNAEKAIEKRIQAVAGSGDFTEQITFHDLFDVEDIQKIQDEFCEATGVASIITRPDGTPITKPSNFCRLCEDVIRKTDKGLANCMHSDATLGRHHTDGPIVQPCLSGGLWDAGASITVAGRHIASWLIGQVRDETQTEEEMLKYADEIGVDRKLFLEAFREVPSMSEERFHMVADLLFTIANQISFTAFQNLQQTRYIVDQAQSQKELKRNASRMSALLSILQYETDELQDFLDHALNEAIEMTESKIGYIYFYDDKNRQFILNSWSNGVMKECAVVNPQTCYDLDKTGIWGEAVRQDKPIMLNDFQAEHPLKKGLPEGHVQLEKYLTVPIHSGGKIVAVIGVANKNTDYDDTDIMQLTLLMDSVWKTVEKFRSEAALKDNEQYLRTILQTTIDGFFVLDGQGCFCDANGAYCKMSGYSREELVGRHINEIDADESPEETLKRIKTIKEKGYAVFESRHRRKDGTTIEVESAVSALKDGSNRLVAFTRDISDRKKAQKALRKSEERYRLIAENTVDCIWMADMELNMLYVNQAVETIFGYTPGEVIGTNLLAYCDDEKVREIMHIIADKLEGNPELAEAEFEASFYAKDGSLVPVEIHGAIIFDEDGKAKALQGVTRDITERKKAEAELRQSEERFRILLEDIAMVSVQGYAPDGTALYWNKGSEELYGYSREEAIGKNLLELIIPPEMREGVHQAMRQMAETGVAIPASELTLMRQDGSLVDVFSCHSIVQHPDREQELYCVDIDLTEIKEAEAHREQLQEQLTQAQKMESVGRLAGGVAHDFNNMLNVIIGHTDMLLEDVAENSPFLASLGEIKKAGIRSADLTRQLLAFARKQTIAPKILDMNETIGKMLDMLRRLIGENIQLTWKPGSRLEKVRIDPTQLDQVLANLVVNARDAIHESGKIIIETEMVDFDDEYCQQHAGAQPGRYAMVVVSDDGHGMDADTMERVFEPFFTTKSVGEGTGLGLSTVYGIVKQNDGFVNVYSEPERGTTFRIYFPVADSKVSGKENAQKQDNRYHESGQETILMVEDETSVLGLGQKLLERAGYKVLAAENANKAIQTARQHPGGIDLLLTDVIMPEMNGRDLALKIMRLYPDITCIFMSGYTANVIAHQGVLDEGVNFLQKPFNSRSLQDAVRKALQKNK